MKYNINTNLSIKREEDVGLDVLLTQIVDYNYLSRVVIYATYLMIQLLTRCFIQGRVFLSNILCFILANSVEIVDPGDRG
jgi:hypothetical protein